MLVRELSTDERKVLVKHFSQRGTRTTAQERTRVARSTIRIMLLTNTADQNTIKKLMEHVTGEPYQLTENA